MPYVMYPGCDHVIKESREREKEGNKTRNTDRHDSLQGSCAYNIIVIYGMGKS